MRYAIYFTPPEHDPLTRAASAWLGRDAFSGLPTTGDTPEGMDAAEFSFRTAEPRRYGFHATVVAPFQMNEMQNEEALFAAFDRFCATQEAFPVSLEVKGILSFVAIMEAVQSRPLNAMAAAAVEFFQPYLAPLTEAEIARRKPEQLTSRQLLLLHRWGYPYVMEEFRFHMTLSNSLESAAHAAMERAAQERFAPLLARPVEIGGLAMFYEPEPGAPFMVVRHRQFMQTAERKTA
jgi:putative phosphonate metabolism protein